MQIENMAAIDEELVSFHIHTNVLIVLANCNSSSAADIELALFLIFIYGDAVKGTYLVILGHFLVDF